MEDTRIFTLPDGRTTVVGVAEAKEIAAGLWELGVTSGAAVAATRIVDALRTNPVLRAGVAFEAREVDALLRAAPALAWSSI